MTTLLAALTFLLLSSPGVASEPVSKSYWRSIAIGGHDSVAYHSRKTPDNHTAVEGSGRFVVTWNNAKWLFASQASADKFAADPQRYRPQYNGYCSNALSIGEGLVDTDGSVWEFFADDLHLFYAERGRQRWLNGDWQTYKQAADAAWQTLSKQ